jgi:HSP20 family protein
MNMKITKALLVLLVAAPLVAVADAATESPAATQTPGSAPAQTPDSAQAQTQKPSPADRPTRGNQAGPSADNRDYDPWGYEEWDPYLEIQRMQEEMDRIMDQAFNRYDFDPYYDPYYGRRGDRDYGRNYDRGPRPQYGPGHGPRMEHGPGFGQGPGFMHSMRGMTPAVDVQDNGDNYVVLVDVPGMDANNISVTLEGDRLSISAKQSYDKEDKDSHGNVIYRERHSGSFRRSMTMPGPVKEKGMKTDYDKGVLRITIPKA